jgi:alkaline phosphatase
MPTRRVFLQGTTLMLAGPGLQTALTPPTESRKPTVRFGVLTDVHYADKDAAGTRHYRDSLEKLRTAVDRLNREELDFVVELGDLIDSAGGEVDAELAHLDRIEREYARLSADRHYVLGNHCVHTLTKQEFIDLTAMKTPHYSFDHGGVHFVALDSCFTSDGTAYERDNFEWTDPNVPADQVEWLTDDLAKAGERPTIVLVHQRLDDTDHYSVKNAAEVREVLEKSGRTLAVFQGHSHENAHVEINGIHYCVVRAMVEGAGSDNNGYARVEVFDDGTIAVHGYEKQLDRRFKTPANQ